VYAVGTYVDFLSMSAVKNRPESEIEQALLDPMYPRTIRIVMNRGYVVLYFVARTPLRNQWLILFLLRT